MAANRASMAPDDFLAMGVMRWMARKGAVGGTARWAALGYHSYHAQAPEMETAHVIGLLLSARYGSGPSMPTLVEVSAHLGEAPGLHDLVVAILAVEAGYLDNTASVQGIFDDVIEQELLRAGVPEPVVRGGIARAA